MLAAENLRAYADTHFLTLPAFLEASGLDATLFAALVEARALPGPIYRLWRDGTSWSPIGGWVGTPRDATAKAEWFSPAATVWARRATLMARSGATPEAIAQRFHEAFAADFAREIAENPFTRFGYPELLANAAAPGLLPATTKSEWDAWINGGYAVCLRRFDARHLVVKNAQALRIRHITDEGRKPALSPAEILDLLDAIEQLDAVMLPFAPHQRPHGTPGKWIDAILARYDLGKIALPAYFSGTDSAPPSRICA